MTSFTNIKSGHFPPSQGLYNPINEHDACGVGFVANLNGVKSHEIVRNGIKILENLLHRGAVGGDLKTGDGAGILVQIPHDFFKKVCQSRHINLPVRGEYGVGMIFMPRGEEPFRKLSRIMEKTVSAEGLEFIGWRKVHLDMDAIHGHDREQRPTVMQCFI